MTSRRGSALLLALLLAIGPAASGRARAQFGVASGPGYPSVGYPSVSYPSFGQYGGAAASGTTYSGFGFGGTSSSGYNVGNGGVGGGYQSAGRIYQQSYRARPQTTVALQPLYSAITSLPGWNGPTRRVRRRPHPRPSPPRESLFDRDGKVLWPSTIPTDPSAVAARQAADDAVRAVVQESNSTGHASVRPVSAAKNKLTAFEQLALPEVRAKNVTDAATLETFIYDLENALDALSYTY